eukprot:2221234-Amphidinium_carterae.1
MNCPCMVFAQHDRCSTVGATPALSTPQTLLSAKLPGYVPMCYTTHLILRTTQAGAPERFQPTRTLEASALGKVRGVFNPYWKIFPRFGS